MKKCTNIYLYFIEIVWYLQTSRYVFFFFTDILLKFLNPAFVAFGNDMIIEFCICTQCGHWFWTNHRIVKLLDIDEGVFDTQGAKRNHGGAQGFFGHLHKEKLGVCEPKADDSNVRILLKPKTISKKNRKIAKLEQESQIWLCNGCRLNTLNGIFSNFFSLKKNLHT